MQDDLYIGIDLGTSSVKLLLLNGAGQILKKVSREYPISFPKEGWAEQDPDEWVDKTLDALPELLQEADPAKVKGIGCGGQMHGLVILDEDDRVIRPVILWNDGRTAEETDYLNKTIGRDKVSEWTGNIAFAGFTAPKLLWLKKHEPENFMRIRKAMLPKDYLVYRLSGAFATDYSDASGTLYLDVKNKCWSKEMLEILDLKEEYLPSLHESYEAVGTLKPEIAARFSLSPDVVLAAGAGDNAAAAVGTGVTGPGACNISVGTSGTIFITGSHFVMDPNNALHAFAHADGSYHLMGVTMSAASCNKWWNEEILNTSDFTAEQEKIGELGENRVYFLPYLMGERSPHNDADARAAFVGMSMATTRGEMTQAVLEGVAFAFRDSLEIAKAEGIVPAASRICGGGAKSAVWRRILANVLDLPLEAVENEEGPGLGGAILSMVACGAYDNVDTAAKAIVRVRETETPDPELVAKYNARYQYFKKLYPALKAIRENRE